VTTDHEKFHALLQYLLDDLYRWKQIAETNYDEGKELQAQNELHLEANSILAKDLINAEAENERLRDALRDADINAAEQDD
jgi:hypothetical protein